MPRTASLLMKSLALPLVLIGGLTGPAAAVAETAPIMVAQAAGDVPITAQLTIRIQQLEGELRSMNGQIEDLNQTVNQLKQRIDRLTSDLEFRIGELEKKAEQAPATATASAAPATAPAGNAPAGNAPAATAAPAAGAAAGGAFVPGQEPRPLTPPTAGSAPAASAPAASAAAAPPRVQLPQGNARTQYTYAFEFVQKQDYVSAEQALKAFIQAHPNDDLAGNAQYWLGETFYVRGNYGVAAEQFLTGYQKYPKNSKAPDNLLKLGLSLANTGKTREACAAYGRFEKEYPQAAAFLKSRVNEEQKRLKCT